MKLASYDAFFERATGHSPYPYQQRLAGGAPGLLRVPTGLGKTEATVISWLYRRITAPEATPRRLLYCLPMRSLVEQTRDRIAACFRRLASDGLSIPRIDVVMGGDVDESWWREPEASFVVVGTQDMLLSRALNRGYAMSRFVWPMTFAAANDDVYWVVDEVQLQGIGAVTAAQLQGFRERLGTFHPTELTLTSATVDPSWFETADFSLGSRPSISLDEADLANDRVARIYGAHKTVQRISAYEPKDVAAAAVERHVPGTRTLVIVNRVSRAQEVYRRVKRDSEAEVVLLHSRFRPEDRDAHAAAAIADVEAGGAGRIVVATQAIEAGVDISSKTLITDVAPWSSLVQRFGRCNRGGEESDASCLWLDGGEPKKNDAPPYEPDDLVEARRLLIDLDGRSVAPSGLPSQSIPLRTGLVIRKPEFLDLFDTSPDLAGHDVDVSAYIRDANDTMVQLFWREEPPGAKEVPHRKELCAAPMSEVRGLVKRLRDDGHGADAQIPNQFKPDVEDPAWGSWSPAAVSDVRPGALVWLRSDVGSYDAEYGFDVKAQSRVTTVDRDPTDKPTEDVSLDADRLSEIGVAVSITRHAQDTERHAIALAANTSVPDATSTIVRTAALWHDVGKAHKVFQDTMRRSCGDGYDPETLWAKGIRRAHHSRRGFRHELPGALAFLNAHGDDPYADVIAYLIAAHHGKMRLAAQQLPYEAAAWPLQILGNQEGEELPPVDLGSGEVTPVTTVTLESFKVASPSGARTWVERTTNLRDSSDYGPFRLAFMELLVRLSDWRASKGEECE
ncbi:MAG TPA: CRISPR-associated helicase Cas3' [Candidatus Tumulicola sp.]|nr:CRISPR-associated helicase Cas3' [Candidatus Tumulicola sp.]